MNFKLLFALALVLSTSTFAAGNESQTESPQETIRKLNLKIAELEEKNKKCNGDLKEMEKIYKQFQGQVDLDNQVKNIIEAGEKSSKSHKGSDAGSTH